MENGTDYGELRGVSITGHATLVTDKDLVREIGSAVVASWDHRKLTAR